MFYMRFLKLFSNLDIFFQKNHILAFWDPFLEKVKILGFFEKNIFRGMTYILFEFFKHFSNLGIIFEKSIFGPMEHLF